MDKAYAPFTFEQQKRLHLRQGDITKHSYTCCGCEPSKDLLVNGDGLFCPDCGYTQQWVHKCDVDG